MTAPRGIEARLKWMLDNPPGVVGMCARTCWQALGGDRGNPPAWGTPDANAVYDKIIASGRYWRDDPPRGALIAWRYGQHGHTALSLGKGRIRTTDPSGKPGGVGDESITYPHKWGASATRRIWTDQYNGTRFPVADEEDDMPLSDDDIDRIAKAVWRWEIKDQPHAMAYMVRKTFDRVATLMERTKPSGQSAEDE